MEVGSVRCEQPILSQRAISKCDLIGLYFIWEMEWHCRFWWSPWRHKQVGSFTPTTLRSPIFLLFDFHICSYNRLYTIYIIQFCFQGLAKPRALQLISALVPFVSNLLCKWVMFKHIMAHMPNSGNEQSGNRSWLEECCFMRNFIRCISRIFIIQFTILRVFLLQTAIFFCCKASSSSFLSHLYVGTLNWVFLLCLEHCYFEETI